MNINEALMSTLHNDMLVIIQKLDLKSSSVNFRGVNGRFRCVGREEYFSGLSLFVRLVEVCYDDLDFSL